MGLMASKFFLQLCLHGAVVHGGRFSHIPIMMTSFLDVYDYDLLPWGGKDDFSICNLLLLAIF